MAKKSAVNKSQAIRDALAAHPDKSPSEIAELLKADGIVISAQYVSTIKSNARVKAKRPVGRRGRQARGAAGGGGAMNTMDAALALIKSAGGLEQAKNVLATIEQISQVIR